MSWRATVFQPGLFPQLRDSDLRGSVDAMTKFLGTLWPAKRINLDRGKVPIFTLHAEAKDGASGPLGHLGAVVARVESQ